MGTRADLSAHREGRRTGALKALAFFRTHSTRTQDGRRYIVYPNDSRGHTGTVALVALAHIELLRSPLEAELKTTLRSDLDDYLSFILGTIENGRIPASYAFADGAAFGKPSPYYEGESLLALTKAAHHLGRNDLLETIQTVADAGFKANTWEALAQDPDSSTTKGYYQWSSMSYYEFTQAKSDNYDEYGKRLVSLANWMVRQHRVLDRVKNTAYAYEGLIPALVEARRRGDDESIERLECTILKA